MEVSPCKTPCYRSIHRLYDFKVGGKEDVEIALVDLELSMISKWNSLEEAKNSQVE